MPKPASRAQAMRARRSRTIDHAGGLPDFPDARVHVLDAEHRAALAGTGSHPEDRVRYRPAHWAHRPMWQTYTPTVGGESWFGFDAVRPLEGVEAEVALVPLGGHMAGHSAVAVRGAQRWLLHCGDAYYFHSEVDPDHPRGHPGMDLLQQITEVDRPLRLANHARLRELVRLHGDEVAVFASHDPWELVRLEALGTPTGPPRPPQAFGPRSPRPSVPVPATVSAPVPGSVVVSSAASCSRS
jgi:hypothetical protein